MALVNDQASQASLAGLLSLGCVGTLLLVKPYRDRSNNTVAVVGQIVVFLWINFLLYRVIGVAEGVLVTTGGVILILATIAWLIFATHAVYADLCKADSSIPATTDEENSTSGEISNEQRHGSSSPRDTEVELAVNLSASHDHPATSPGPGASPWQLFSLCAAAPEPVGESSEDAIAAALARRVDSLVKELATKDGVLKQKDKALAQKDEELRTAQALSTGAMD